jgi:hypothetical protein
MAKKETKAPKTEGRKPARKPASRTGTRARKPEVTHEAIAHRAYEIYVSGSSTGAFDDWVRAESELRA